MSTPEKHSIFLEKIAQKGIQVEVLEEYINSATPINCKCKLCGFIWKTRPNNLLRGHFCPKCSLKKRVAKRTKNQDSFLFELKKINPTIKPLEEYKGARTPILCECLVCGKQWLAAPTNLLKEKGCPACARKTVSQKLQYSHEEFLGIIRKNNKDITPLEEYRGQSFPILMKCNICGYQWKPFAASILAGHGCPKCAKNAVLSQEEFTKALLSINPYIKILGKYQRNHIPVKCKCLRCNHEWKAKPNNLLNGRGCPNCSHSSTSFFEQVLYEVFCFHLGEKEVKSRNCSAIGKELDIYIPSLNLAIEPGSWRWHQNKLDNDSLKRDLCKKAGIRLISIYSDYTELSPPFTTDCICVKETLGFEKDIPVVKKIISVLFSMVGVSLSLSSAQWEEIIKISYTNSRRKTTEDFKNEINLINNKITILGDYTGAWNKIKCECKICGHSWYPIANNLVRGTGCPSCANKNRNRKKKNENAPTPS